MRMTRPFLALSLVLLAGPAFAQSGPGMHDSQAQTPQDRYEIVPNQQGQMPQNMMQKMQDMMQHRGMMQNMPHGMMQGMQGMQSGSSGRHMGQAGQFNPEIVSSATREKIKESLEQSGFKNVHVVPQAYLIRAEAPDGSRVVMQVNPEGLSGVVVEQQQGTSTGSSSTGSDSGTSAGQQNR